MLISRHPGGVPVYSPRAAAPPQQNFGYAPHAAFQGNVGSCPVQSTHLVGARLGAVLHPPTRVAIPAGIATQPSGIATLQHRYTAPGALLAALPAGVATAPGTVGATPKTQQFLVGQPGLSPSSFVYNQPQRPTRALSYIPADESRPARAVSTSSLSYSPPFSARVLSPTR
ncbi:unnamed protein product, partial [Polarella glacialis]